MFRLEASSGVRLVTSISARSVSPSEDCTARAPRPSARASEATSHKVAAAIAVSAKRPAYSEFLIKASPKIGGGGSERAPTAFGVVVDATHIHPRRKRRNHNNIN